MTTDVETGEAVEGRRVRGDDRSPGRRRRRRDQEIVRSARRAPATYFHEQSRMCLGDRNVVGDHGHRREDILHERSPGGSGLPAGEESTDS